MIGGEHLPLVHQLLEVVPIAFADLDSVACDSDVHRIDW